jgi:hypothetical protein
MTSKTGFFPFPNDARLLSLHFLPSVSFSPTYIFSRAPPPFSSSPKVRWRTLRFSLHPAKVYVYAKVQLLRPVRRVSHRRGLTQEIMDINEAMPFIHFDRMLHSQNAPPSHFWVRIRPHLFWSFMKYWLASSTALSASPETGKPRDKIIVSGCDLTPYMEAFAPMNYAPVERWLKEENRLSEMAVVGSVVRPSEVGRDPKL